MLYYAKGTTSLCSSLLAYLFLSLLYRNVFVYSKVTFPTPTYAPFEAECPTDKPLLRMAGSAMRGNQTLSPEEQAFRTGRQLVTRSLWREFFTHGPGNATGYGDTLLMAPNQDDWPTLGIAISGGGPRAVLYGAGVLHALDAGTTSSPIRGVYQLATYATGVSGGSWLIASMAANDYPTIPDLFSSLKMEIDIIFPMGGGLYDNWKFFQNILFVVLQKQLAFSSRFRTSIIDFWSVALGQHFLPAVSTDDFDSTMFSTPRGLGLLFSSFRNTSALSQFRKPLPIIVSNHQPLVDGDVNPQQLPIQGKTFSPLSAPIYETSPFEFGSFDPQLSAFTPTEFLGTSLESGKPVTPKSFNSYSSQPKKCVRGFDQISFIMGSSAAICDAAARGDLPGFPASFMSVMNYILQSINGKDPLVAHYPNPFKGVNGPVEFDRSTSDELLIVDGGENGENIPLNPLLTPARRVDVLLAADASSDTDSNYELGANWPNGASMINTWLRNHKVLPLGTGSFPSVPLQPQVWMEKGFNTRPTFFGCNVTSIHGNGGYPLIIYLPNSPLSPIPTNTSTFKLQYATGEKDLFLQSATNSTMNPRFGPQKIVDPDWPTCLSCALIDRSRNRLNVARSAACQKCFARYCYQDSVLPPASH